MNVSSRPAIRVAPAATVRRAQAQAPAARPAVRPAATPAPGEALAQTRTIGTALGAAAGGLTGWLFGSVLAAGGMSGLFPIAGALAGGALLARGGAVLADAAAGRAKRPTLAQGLVGGTAGAVMGLGVWGLTAFAAGMGGAGLLFAAAIPMGLIMAVVGGTAVGSFVPRGEK